MNNETIMNFGEFYHLTVGHTFKAKVGSDGHAIDNVCLLVTDAKQGDEGHDAIEVKGLFVSNGWNPVSSSDPTPCVRKISGTTDAETFLDEWASCDVGDFYKLFYGVMLDFHQTGQKYRNLLWSANHCGVDAGC